MQRDLGGGDTGGESSGEGTERGSTGGGEGSGEGERVREGEQGSGEGTERERGGTGQWRGDREGERGNRAVERGQREREGEQGSGEGTEREHWRRHGQREGLTLSHIVSLHRICNGLCSVSQCEMQGDHTPYRYRLTQFQTTSYKANVL